MPIRPDRFFSPAPLALALAFAGLGVTGCQTNDHEMGAFHDDSVRTIEQGVHRVCGGGSTVEGIDISHYQGSINWSSVAASNVEFAIMKATESTGFVDSRFAANWRNSGDAGLIRGAYHFFRANRDGHQQATHFLNAISTVGGLTANDLPLVIDVETMDGVSSSTARSRLSDMVNDVYAATGRRPIIYSAGYFWDDNSWGSGFASNPLWVANYTTATCPRAPDAWNEWIMWQYTDSGSVPGITGNVDRNRFNGTLTDLYALVGSTPDTDTTGPGTPAPIAPVCDIPDGRTGICLNTSECGANMVSVPGHCDGPTNVQCCVPISASQACDIPDGRNGDCSWVHECTGESVSGHCPGHDQYRCCVADTSAPVCGDGVCDAGETCSADCGTPVPDGVPASWTCDPSLYNGNNGCHCGCGAYDQDCDRSWTIIGCEAGQTCTSSGVCSGAEGATVCGNLVCEEGEQASNCNSDCIGFCGDTYCDAWGEPDWCDADCSDAPGPIEVPETAPASWTCNTAWYNTDDGCDCECGAYDPDCNDASQFVYNCAWGQYCGSDAHCTDSTGRDHSADPTPLVREDETTDLGREATDRRVLAEDDDSYPEARGCATSPTRTSAGWMSLAMLGLLWRRRRR